MHGSGVCAIDVDYVVADDGMVGFSGACDLQNAAGEHENWAMEMGSPNGLMRRGWTRNTLAIGDVVTVTGSRAKDGSFKGNARSVVLSTGQRLFAGSSQPGAEGDTDQAAGPGN